MSISSSIETLLGSPPKIPQEVSQHGGRVLRTRPSASFLTAPAASRFTERFPDLYSLLQPMNVKVSIETQEEEIHLPALFLLDKIVKGYQKKYNICIRLCGHTKVDNLLYKLFEQEEQQPVGFIIYANDFEHVTPFLFHANRAIGREIVVLDSIGVNLKDSYQSIACSGVKGTCDWLFSEEERQSDYGSCNIEAACILRTALLHIRHLGTEFRSLRALVKASLGSSRICQLPAQWTYFDQMTETIQPYEWNQMTIKYLESKQKEITIQEANQRFFGIKKHIVVIDLLKASDQAIIENFIGQYPDLHYENGCITWKIAYKVNAYLALKGQKKLKQYLPL
ncbi:MAG: hypothetical protein V4494_00610 [Chlamydiota bacterium]